MLTGYEKAAIFLRTIGEDRAAEVLKSLAVDEISKLSSYMSKVGSVGKADVDLVFREASDRITTGELQPVGTDYIRRILEKVLGVDRAERVLSLIESENPIESLQDVDPKTLANFLVTEHPQTVALALCLLEPPQAAEVLANLPDTIKSDVAMRVASTERIPTHAIEELEEALKGLEMNRGKGTKVGGIKTVAEILNQSDRTTEQMILENIDEHDTALADSIRQLMFVFEDLSGVDDRGIQSILKEVSTDDLSLALKTASETIKEKVFKNMSTRAATILQEEMEVKGPVRVSEVEKAQQNIVKVARRLEEEGRIVLGGKGGEQLV